MQPQTTTTQWCLHCGKKATLACACCSVAHYCDKECQKKDFKYHRYEAKVIDVTPQSFSRKTGGGGDGGMDVEDGPPPVTIPEGRKRYKVTKSFVTHAKKIRGLREELEAITKTREETMNNTSATTKEQKHKEAVTRRFKKEILAEALVERETEENDSFERLAQMARLFDKPFDEAIVMATIQVPYVRRKRELADEFAVATAAGDYLRVAQFYKDIEKLNASYQYTVFDDWLLRDIFVSPPPSTGDDDDDAGESLLNDDGTTSFSRLVRRITKGKEEIALGTLFAAQTQRKEREKTTHLTNAIFDMVSNDASYKLDKRMAKYMQKRREQQAAEATTASEEEFMTPHKRKVETDVIDDENDVVMDVNDKEQPSRKKPREFLTFAVKKGDPVQPTVNTRSRTTRSNIKQSGGEAEKTELKRRVKKAGNNTPESETLLTSREQRVAEKIVEDVVTDALMSQGDDSPQNIEAEIGLVDVTIDQIRKDHQARVNTTSAEGTLEHQIEIGLGERAKNWFKSKAESIVTSSDAFEPGLKRGLIGLAIAATFGMVFAFKYNPVVSSYLPHAADYHLNQLKEALNGLADTVHNFVNEGQEARESILKPIFENMRSVLRGVQSALLPRLLSPNYWEVMITNPTTVGENGAVATIAEATQTGTTALMTHVSNNVVPTTIAAVDEMMATVNPLRGMESRTGDDTVLRVLHALSQALRNYRASGDRSVFLTDVQYIHRNYNEILSNLAGFSVPALIDASTISMDGMAEYMNHMRNIESTFIPNFDATLNNATLSHEALAGEVANMTLHSTPVLTALSLYLRGDTYLLGPHCSTAFTDLFMNIDGGAFCRVSANAQGFESGLVEISKTLNTEGYNGFKSYLPFIGNNVVRSTIFANTMCGVIRAGQIMACLLGGSMRIAGYVGVAIWEKCSSWLGYAKARIDLGDDIPDDEEEAARRQENAEILAGVDDILSNMDRTDEVNITEAAEKLKSSGWGLLAFMKRIWQSDGGKRKTKRKSIRTKLSEWLTYVIDTVIAAPFNPISGILIDAGGRLFVHVLQLQIMSGVKGILSAMYGLVTSFSMVEAVSPLISSAVAVTSIKIASVVLVAGLLYYLTVRIRKRYKGLTITKLMNLTGMVYYRFLLFAPIPTLFYSFIVFSHLSHSYLPLSFQDVTNVTERVVTMFSSLDAHGVPDPNLVQKQIVKQWQIVDAILDVIKETGTKYNTTDKDQVNAVVGDWVAGKYAFLNEATRHYLGPGVPTLFIGQ